MAPRPRTLIGGVGYRYTRDLAFGPLLIDRIRSASWPDGVEVEDLSYAPIAIVQKWRDAPYDRIVLAGAVPRDVRLAGTLCRYCPTGILPDPKEIQDRVGEALTGIVSLENLLVVTRHFGVLPRDVEVIEVEPQDVGWGDGLSPRVQAAQEPAIEMIRDAVGERGADASAIEGLRQRDEILQVMFWLEGEGLASDVRAANLRPFVDGEDLGIDRQLEILRRQGYVEQTGNEPGRYRLSVVGRGEGRRRFTEEFAPLLRQGHGECNDPACECHVTGNLADCVSRRVDR